MLHPNLSQFAARPRVNAAVSVWRAAYRDHLRTGRYGSPEFYALIEAEQAVNGAVEDEIGGRSSR